MKSSYMVPYHGSTGSERHVEDILNTDDRDILKFSVNITLML